VGETVASDASISADNVTALIVTYGSRAHLTSAVIRRLSDIDVAQIILVDNGSEPTARDAYQTLAVELSQLKVLSLPENLGSAEGFAAGIKDYLANSNTTYLWVWTTTTRRMKTHFEHYRMLLAS
jgi:GT2 family glycosyltransferase